MGLVAERLAAFIENNVRLGDETSVPFRSSRIDITNETRLLPFCYSTLMRSSFLSIVLLGWLLLEAPVEAYLDPGSGGMLLQVLLGGFAAAGVIARLYWSRVKDLLRRKGAPGDGR